MQKLITTSNPAEELTAILREYSFSKLFVLTDENVNRLYLPLLRPLLDEFNADVMVIPAGEEHKSVETLIDIWRWLSESGGTRNSLMINVGGGVITDIGGFAAASFKRGIRFLNLPTTVLGAADASVGGKTGIDFAGLKNEIGAFAKADAVVISGQPLATLPRTEWISGYAEVVKMAMIRNEEIYRGFLTNSPLDNALAMQEAIAFAVREKAIITDEDPREAGLRKVLNLGHTCGHAFETLLIEQGRPVPHGVAVAHGILVALILSHLLLQLPSEQISLFTSNILKPYYGNLGISCKDYPRLIELMGRDKKNSRTGEVRFVLLERIGVPAIDVVVDTATLETALDIYQNEA